MKWKEVYEMKNYKFTGLKTSPSRLKETMIPNISPETVADTKVQVSGGYETCQFGVSVDTFTVELSWPRVTASNSRTWDVSLVDLFTLSQKIQGDPSRLGPGLG